MRMLVKIIKSLIFYPMLWLRTIFKFVLNCIAVLSFLMSILNIVNVGGLSRDYSSFALFLGISFVAFLLSFLYDIILLKLNPTDITLEL